MTSSSDDAFPGRGQDPSAEGAAAIEEIAVRLERSLKALFDVLGGEAAIAAIDRALELVPQVPEELRTHLGLIVEANHAFARGIVQLGTGGDLATARGHFERAKQLVAELREESLQEDQLEPLELFQLGIEAKLVETTLATVEDEEERARAEAPPRRAHARDVRARRARRRRVRDVARAVQPRVRCLRRSTAALAVLDLEEATRRIDEATQAMGEMEAELDRAAEADETRLLTRFGEMLRAFRPLVSGQQAYVTALHDAIVGDARERHVAMLDQADADLRKGLERLSSVAGLAERTLGQLAQPLPLAELEASVGHLRQIVGNVRRLVREAASPKEVTRRSAPRFVAYFAIALAVILAGVRVSGLVPELGGTELVTIVLIALVVWAGASFGWEVAIRFVEAVPWPGDKPKEELPPGRAESA